MIKKFFHCALTFGLFALIFVLNFSVTNAAPVQLPDNPVTSKKVSSVSDRCGLLSAADIDSLTKKIQRVEAAHKVKIAISFVKSTNGQDIIDASDNLRDKLPAAPNGKIVLLVSMDNRRYEMSTDTVMMNIITQSDGIPHMKNKIEPELHDGNYSGACNNFIDGVDELLTYYETNGQPYANTEGDFIIGMLGAIVLALTAFYYIRSYLIGTMSNIRHAAKATDYLEKNSVKLTDTDDMFLFSHVSRSKKSSSNSSSGGHRGGGGGGGSF